MHVLHLSFCISGAPSPRHNKPEHTSPMTLTATSATDSCPQCLTALSLTDGVSPVCAANDEAEDGAVEETDGVRSSSKGKDKGRVDTEKHGGCSPKKGCKEFWYDTRMKLWEIVESKYFNRGIMIAILINTISMGIEHHEQVQAVYILNAF